MHKISDEFEFRPDRTTNYALRSKKFPIDFTMGKWCLHASLFIFDRIIIKVADNQDRHKSSDEFDFGRLVSMAYLYSFEMRFGLGTLDSGERSLPFGLLVLNLYIKSPYSGSDRP